MKTLFTLILALCVGVASVGYTACGGAEEKEVELEAGKILPPDQGVRILFGLEGKGGVALFHTEPKGPSKKMVQELREIVLLNPEMKLVTCHSATLPVDLRKHLLLAPSNKRVKGMVLAYDRERNRIHARFWLEK